MEPLVSTDWLAAELGKPDLVVFDATIYLPNEPRTAARNSCAAHIPGARFFDIDEIADPDTDLPHMVPAPGRFARLIGAMGVSNDSARGVLRPEGPVLGGARLVADGAVRPRPRGGAGWRAAEMAARGPARPRPASRRRRSPADVHAQISAPPGCAASATCCAISNVPRGTGAGRPRRRPLHRHSAGAAAGHARRPHPRLAATCPTPSCSPPDQTFLPPDALRARFARRRRGRHPPGGDQLRLRRHRLHPHARPGPRRPAAGRGVRRVLDRMGRPRRHAGGELSGWPTIPHRRSRGTSDTRLSHAGRAGTRVHGLRQSAAAARLHGAATRPGRAPRLGRPSGSTRRWSTASWARRRISRWRTWSPRSRAARAARSSPRASPPSPRRCSPFSRPATTA